LTTETLNLEKQTMNVTVAYVGPTGPVITNSDVTRAAQNARMYRLAARSLREFAKQDRQSAMSVFCGVPSARKTELLAKARRMERNARAAEKAIVKAADTLIAYAGLYGVPVTDAQVLAEVE
jgi:hypothetical protein